MDPQMEPLTLPFRFHVPVNIVQCFGEEYSIRLSPREHDRIDPLIERVPLF